MDGPRVDPQTPEGGRRDAVTKAEARFGKDWLKRETRGGKEGVVLKTLAECRAALESRANSTS